MINGVATLKSSQSKNNFISIKTVIFCGALLAVVTILAFFWQFSIRNYASEIASQIGAKLTNAGAIKVCDVGDSGRGIDNRSPWTIAYYEIAKNNEQTTQIIMQAAADAGYTNLMHATPTNKGFLDGVIDEHIDHFYFDNTSRNVEFTDLMQGKIELALSTYNDHGSIGEPCEGRTLTINQEHTVIAVNVRLPAFAH